MSTTGSFPLNELPVELQREIFVVAAKVNQNSALQLARVAKRIHSWVQPLIYEMVTLGSDDTDLFLKTMNSISSEFFGIYVKKLCLSVSVSARNAARILTVCTGVIDLAFWVDYLGMFPNRSILPLISPLPLSRLSMEYNHFLSLFPEPETRHPWCDTLTHLDIIFWTHETAPAVPHLDKLSQLTHLALRLRHSQPDEESLLAIVSACRRLKVLVIFDDTETEETAWPADPRVIYMPYPQNIVGEWEAQAKWELDNIWSRAEDLVRRHIAERERLYFFRFSR
ncbi:hypothetical protein GALMADRAFT_62319 [Galerina marginata CBS 339.88]|uniref:F-box domain-containing protein n=1 Tax=Galerina marginata (strain CBS 339.88) TaxID=685588 RepID=A0A067TAW1_GALM3|nr:hypothetical protein GALMADRAFT_62319 [Galerina marginata CBS 339.88]